MKKKTESTGKKVAAGVAAAAVAAGAAAGAYYLYGSKNAKQNRKKVGAWVASARKEVEREAKKLKDAALNEKNYKAIVKTVGERYKTLKKLDSKDVMEFVHDVNRDWQKLSAKGKTVAKKAKSVAKKVKKRATK